MAVEVSQGVCDLCGAPSDASLQECNWLTCTFQHCEGGLYHQECLEKYLKSNKLEKNRKTGFKCPRGCGKGTRFDQACPGRIDKSHPLHPRNEDKKKTKLAAVVVEPQRPTKPVAPVATNGKPAKGKEESKPDAGKDAKSVTQAKPAPAAKAATTAAAAAPVPVVGHKIGKKEPATLPPRPEIVAKQKLAELAAQARRELGLPAVNSGPLSTHGSKGDLQVLASTTAVNKPAAPTASAWGKPSTPTPEPSVVSPQPAMMSQLPQFQQLLQQAVGKKVAAKAPATASPPAAAHLPKPAPAVPQPVLNPPTPVWPALGAAQTTTAALLSSSGPSSGKDSSARPSSPQSAWGSAPPAAPAQQQSAAQSATQPTSQTGTSSSSVQTTPVRTQAGAGTASAAASASSASSASAAGSLPATLQGPAAAATGAGAGYESTQITSSTGPYISARCGTTEALPASTAACGSGAVSTPLRSPVQLVGAEFTDDEVKDSKLTKAQKKNLKRAEKKKTPAGEHQHGAGEAGQDGAELHSRSSHDGTATPPLHSASTATAAGRVTDLASTSVSGRTGGAGSGVHKLHGSRGSDDPEQAHIAEAEEAAVMEELCINCMVARKVLTLITQLQRLGALEFVAAAAVQRHGSNLLNALEWLLVAGADAANSVPEVVLAAAAESASAGESEIDISEELQQLSDLQAAMGVPTELLQQCVVDCSGDVQTAANTAMERLLAAPSGSALGMRAATPGERGRLSSSSGSLLASGPGNCLPMRPSTSCYSMSSLDGAAGCTDADAAASHMKLQPQAAGPFCVRQHDEPAGISGYGGVGSYAAGLMRGGVVLGAASWHNGYLRDVPPPVVNGPTTGRSTSRLLHWLRDDSGRAAVLEEEPAASSGLLGPGDAVMESPFGPQDDMVRGLGPSKAGPEIPSMHNWLGTNGYLHHTVGVAGAGHAGVVAQGGVIPGPHELYGGARNNGNFSFMSAVGRPASSLEGPSSSLDSVAAYDSRWVSVGPQRRAGPQLYGAAAVTGAEGESVPQHTEGDNDLSSIMALINVR